MDVTEQGDSIEKLFAEQFEKLSQYPMDNETSEIYIKLLLLKDSDIEIPQKDKPFLYQIIENRISFVHNYKLDNRTILFLSILCKSAGICVMYIWYLQFECKKRNINEMSFETFSQVFGNGFPSDEGLSKIWDSQKVKHEVGNSDNLLDYVNAGKSLLNY
jgi:hypothetical protein